MSAKRSKKFRRMIIPKNERDFQVIEEEIHEIGYDVERGESRQEENINSLLLNTIMHTLSHIESHMNNIGMRLRELNESIDEVKTLLNTLIKAMILRELPNEKARRKLMLNILHDLKE
ncbi:MAG: hypothetical protein B6U85_00310 [Desulfurococcales archaeon ex4484_42]|nr:MAG: hypothetical protein B6U85_00310 [Desulfurococcales archaeon ex4484_42]